MAKINEAELGDDFSYILRIADSGVDGLKPIIHGLTSVKGIIKLKNFKLVVEIILKKDG